MKKSPFHIEIECEVAILNHAVYDKYYIHPCNEHLIVKKFLSKPKSNVKHYSTTVNCTYFHLKAHGEILSIMSFGN